jgi:hypothetical protein
VPDERRFTGRLQTDPGVAAVTVSFSPSEDGRGVTVFDAVEHRQFTLDTAGPVALGAADPDDFYFPVDAAVELDVASFSVPATVGTVVRTAAGEMLAEVTQWSDLQFPEGRYSIELCPSVKCYLQVDGPLSVVVEDGSTVVETAGRTVRMGARSHHKHPEATVTTTGNPHDVMAALSVFGSALKTTTVERSYPTLRGHPPAIELGEELHVPETLRPPETGVTIEVPPRLESIYPVAPLAYYLGARVEPGVTPCIVTDSGFEYVLDGPEGFEEAVARTLKQVFFLDCLTRTEGYYRVDLQERRAVADLVDLDFAALYEASLPDQLEAYLDVPYEVVADHLPEWKLTTHVAPTPDKAELLPFLVNDLAVIRMPASRTVAPSAVQMTALSEFTRDSFTRSASEDDLGTPSLVQPETADSLEQSWAGAGDEAPFGASKASVQAFRNRLQRDASTGDIDITVVCNDAEMDDEGDTAERVYGSRSDLPFDVQMYRDLSVDALRAVLETEADFFHYIGHIDADGFQCADGRLDARDLDRVGVDAFMLNACRSYEQGMALIEAGAVGGVVTLAEVINSGAVRVGGTMARLLNQGFPLRAALTIAKDESIVGSQYIVVGDGNLDVVQSESGMPLLIEIETADPEGYEVTVHSYPNGDKGIGSILQPAIETSGQYSLGSGTQGPFTMAADELERFLELEDAPLRYDGELVWSGDLVL